MMDQEAQAEQKSQRCFSCQRRKVKCDRIHPTCGACTRLSLSCSWISQWKFKDQRKFVEKRYDVTGSIPGSRTWDRLEFVENACILSPPSVSSADDESRSSPQSPVRDLQLQLPASVDPVPSTRLQMLAVALQHYLPYDEQTHQCQNIEQWPTLNLINFKNTSLFTAEPLLNAAVDAFTLAQAAISLTDPRLALASIRRYNTSLHILRVVLKTHAGHKRSNILLSMILLTAVESMRPIAQPGGLYLHIEGMVNFLANEAPQRLGSCYETILFQCARLASIIWSITLGKRTPFDTKEWISLSKSAPLITSETRLLDISVKIPNLLVPHHNTGVSLHLSNLRMAQQSLDHWIEAYRNEKGVILLQAFDPVLFPDFAQLVTSDLGGRQVLWCASYNDAFYLSLAWTLLFVVQLAHLSILINSSEPVLELERKRLEMSLENTASALRSAIPQFFDRNWGFVARTSISLFLQLLNRYYLSVGDDSMVEFCLKVKRALGRPELGHAIVTETKQTAFEHYFSALNVAETSRDAG